MNVGVLMQIGEHTLAFVYVALQPLFGDFTVGDVLQIGESLFIRIGDRLFLHPRVVGYPDHPTGHRRVSSEEVGLLYHQDFQAEVVCANGGAHPGCPATYHQKVDRFIPFSHTN